MLDPADDESGVIVAIPTRNRAELLRRAVESVLAQDHASLTVLVSDNASSDGTPGTCRELATLDPRVTVHRQAVNLGLTGNYNWLMQRALADRSPSDGFFMYLSDDDWLDPTYVSMCIARLREEPDHSLVAGRTILEFDSAPSRPEIDVNLAADSPAERLSAFCQDVLPTGVFSGLMPLDVVCRLPPQRKVLGHDWIFLANVAFLGKVATVEDTALHRNTDGLSTSLVGLTRSLGVSRLQAVRPLMTIGYFMVAECVRRSPIMGRLPVRRRLQLVCVVLLGLFSRRAVPLLTRRPSSRACRAGVRALAIARGAVLMLERAPVGRSREKAWATRDLEAVAACPVCGAVERSDMYSDLPDQVFAIAGGRWNLKRCKACCAAYLDPRPAPLALDRAYGDGYYTHGDVPPSSDVNGGAGFGVRLAGRNAYLNRRYGYDLTPASRLGLAVTYANPRSRAASDRLFRGVRRPRKGARLLDVGCGSGAFVAMAGAVGWDAMGIDTDDAAVSAARAAGLNVSTTRLEDLAGTMSGHFDVVTMAHVIEHVADPVALLRSAHAVLRPSGSLWLVTPNLDSGGHRRFRDRWVHLDPPRHLVLFGREAIDRALCEAGFKVTDTPRSASGSVASFAQSWRIERGQSPLEQSPVPALVTLRGQIAGLRSLLSSNAAEELIRLARPRGNT